MGKNTTYAFLSSFFEMYNADIDVYRIEGKEVVGSIRWRAEDETQDFSWVIELGSVLKRLKFLCEHLLENNLIQGDRITVTQDEMQKRLVDLGWDFSEAQETINCLLSVEIRMLDDGEKTDSFFIHF